MIGIPEICCQCVEKSVSKVFKTHVIRLMAFTFKLFIIESRCNMQIKFIFFLLSIYLFLSFLFLCN